MSRFMAECPHCDDLLDDEDEWFEHVSSCGERCSECGEPGCQGHCAGDDMMGASDE